jgi:hypothetical protein
MTYNYFAVRMYQSITNILHTSREKGHWDAYRS